MTFEVTEPILIIGLGGAGSRLAIEVDKSLDIDCMCISNDKKDLQTSNSIEISTKSIINPSVQLIRGCALDYHEQISQYISRYNTVIIMANLAGKSGAALSPTVSSICK